MPVKSFDEVLSSLSADEKKLIDNVLTKNPELKDGWMRQDDYSRKQNELKAKETEYQEAVSYKTRVEPWAQEAYAIMHDMEEAGALRLTDGGAKDAPKYEVLWADQKKELEQQLQAAKSSIGGDMDEAELNRRVTAIVKANGGVTPEEMKALVQSEAQKLVGESINSRFVEEEKKFNEKTIPFLAGFSSGVAVVASRYEKETGEPWTNEKAKELFELMGKEQNFDPLVAGDLYLKPIRDKKARDKEIQDEVERRVEEEKKKIRGMPGGGDETFIPQEMGHLQKRMQEGGGADLDFEALIKQHAVEGAKELQREGKA